MKEEKLKRGFASMTPAQRTAIARLGGIAAHKKKVAHEWTRAEAAAAGRIGGAASHRARKRI
jgi:hypothetical protein